MSLKRRLFNIIAFATANPSAQKLLLNTAYWLHYIAGVGAGGSTLSSGEIPLIRRLSKMTSSPLIIFDVGANQGQFLHTLLSNLPLDQLDIHCFEPGAQTFAILQKKAQDYPFVTLNNLALGKQSGEAELFYDQVCSGLASLTKRRLDHLLISFDRVEKVQVETVNNYCQLKGIRKIDLLKIDVEGHEMDVLRGATGLLKTGAIRVVLFEFGGADIDTRTFFQDFYYLFQELDMKMFRITPSGYLASLESYSEGYEQFNGATNYVAIREPVTDLYV